MKRTTRRALVIGGVNLDIQGTSLAPFLPGDSNPGTAVWAAGGVGRNIAENLVRLGLETELLTVFGEGAAAEYLRGACDALGLRCGRSLTVRGRAASQYLCLLDSDGTLVGAVADMEIFEELTVEALETRCGAAEALAEADVVAVDANLPAESIAWIASHRSGKPMLLDPVSRTKAERARGCVGGFSLVKPNCEEAAVLSGIDTSTMAGVREAARALYSRGVGEVFISLGRDGLVCCGGHGFTSARPPAIAPVNLSGAGDAAAAALLWATAEGCSLEEKARFAVGAAVITAMAETAVSPSMNVRELETVSKGVVCEPVS